MRTYTASQKLACIEREIRKRYIRYPNLVAAGQMTQKQSDLEIGMMEEVAAEMREQADKERLPQ